MSCVRPLKIHIKGEWQNVECGKCQNCIIKKKSQIEFLAQKEALKMYERGQGCSFTTLTYSNENIPISKDDNGTKHLTLRKKDMQDFIKRVRARKEYYNQKTEYKIIYCGEYGEERGRPHMHLISLGLSDTEIEKYTKRMWKEGLCDNGPLGAGGIRYVTDYMQKTQFTATTKLINECLNIENPFLNHSINLGKDWIIEHEEEIIQEGFTAIIRGKRQFLPKYVRDFVARRNGIKTNEIIERAMKIKWQNASNWKDLELEESLIKEKWYIDAARSKGNQIEIWQKQEKKWLIPKHRIDREDNRKKWKPAIEELLKL